MADQHESTNRQIAAAYHAARLSIYFDIPLPGTDESAKRLGGTSARTHQPLPDPLRDHDEWHH